MLGSSPDQSECSYTITFNESGLPTGSTWDITLNGTTLTTTVAMSASGGITGTSLTFSGLCVGGYGFLVSTPPGYAASPPSGSVTIPVGIAPGSEVYQTIVFSPASECTYTVTFNETGLPWGPAPPPTGGVTWDITLNGVTMTATTVTSTGLPGSSGTTITFSGLCVGQYPFTVSSPSGFSANPSSGTVTIPTTIPKGSEVYVMIAFSPLTPPCSYTITFNETGLPPGASWDVSLNGAEITAVVTAAGGGTTITFQGICVGEYSFTVSSPPGYVAGPSSGTVTVPATVAPGSEVYRTIVFRPTTDCTYTATFNETGLPPGASWDVTLNGLTLTVTVAATGSGMSITFSGLCLGQYPFTVSAPAGYAANPGSGVIIVPAGLPTGAEVYVPVNFTPVTPPCNYTVTFNESGLPPGTVWDVSLNGITLAVPVTPTASGGLVGTTVTFTGLCVGQYSFTVSAPAGYSASPSSGVITVPAGLAAGSEVYVPIAFFPVTPPCNYTVTFNETGLPPGTSWDIALNGLTMTVTVAASGGGTNITFFGLCAGTYTFTVSSPPGYVASPASGTIIVAVGTVPGSEVYQTVVFTLVAPPCNYTATFNETGLPPGTSWDITLNGVTITVTVTMTATGGLSGTTITFSGLCVGQYQFVVSTPPGYVATPPAGTIVVPATLAAGSEVYQRIGFTHAPCQYTVTFRESGLLAGETWDIELNGTTMTTTVVANGGGTITFSGLCVGTYKFTVSSPKGYVATPASGSVTIPPNLPAGNEVYQVIAFENLTFIERGLPSGASWDVTIVGRSGATATITTNTTLISFSVPPGPYRYTVSKPCEYAAKPLSGGVVTGKAVVVVFTLLTKVVAFKESGLPSGTPWGVTVTGPQPIYPFVSTTTTYHATAPGKILITTVCGNYSWAALNTTNAVAAYHPTASTASGTFSIVVTGNVIKKVPTPNPIVIKYVP